MKYLRRTVAFQEVPNHISLSYEITGCPNRCKGCHSPELRNHKIGTELTPEIFTSHLQEYMAYIDCVLFMGGEWYEDELIELLKIAKTDGKKTCLYTGSNEVSDSIKKYLDFLKTGPYIQEFGPLTSPSTNQCFTCVNTGKNLTHLFW